MVAMLKAQRPADPDAAAKTAQELVRLDKLKANCIKYSTDMHKLKARSSNIMHMSRQQQQQQQSAAASQLPVATPDEVASRMTAPSPAMAPSPAAAASPGMGQVFGSNRSAATPPVIVSGSTVHIKPESPPASVLPAPALGSTTTTKPKAEAQTGTTADITAVAPAADTAGGAAAVAAPATPAETELPGPLARLERFMGGATAQQLKSAGQKMLLLQQLDIAPSAAPPPSDLLESHEPVPVSDLPNGALPVYSFPTHVCAADSPAPATPAVQETHSADQVDAAVLEGTDTADTAVATEHSQRLKRRRSEIERECQQVEAQLGGGVKLSVIDIQDDSGAASSLPVSEQLTAGGSSAVAVVLCEAVQESVDEDTKVKVEPDGVKMEANVASDGSKPPPQQQPGSDAKPWACLKLLLPETYPQQPPVAVYDGSGGVGGGAAGDATEAGQESWLEFQIGFAEESAVDLLGMARLWKASVSRGKRIKVAAH